ncbi:MAG TPA: tetratricopeptide repeat protein [Opitutaceae bacterium]|nr:tetratricopeptide repeat protein [Opitutaceae bacterium]
MAAVPDFSRPSFPRRRGVGAALALAAALLLAYAPLFHAGFVWDDDAFVLRPDLHSLHGLARIWTDLSATEQYFPVLHTAFWLEHALWGDAALGYHLANLALHAAAALLLARLLGRLGFAPFAAWLAAFLFALHPVGAESVAWISEQKNTLSTVFYFAAALAFLRWRAGGGRKGYLAATLLFALALLSKTVTATLPAALLVVFWWQAGRLRWREDVRPLLPWFALGAASGLFSGWVERVYIGARGADFGLALPARVLLACRAACFYAGKLAWPAGLNFIYPRWTIRLGDPAGWTAALALACVLATLVLLARFRRGPLACALLYLGALFPTLGFLNVYAFIFSYVADHWQYLALPPGLAGAAWLWERASRSRAALRYGAAGAVLLLFGALTWRQAARYRDPEGFYQAILARNPDAWMAHDNLGIFLANTHREAEAAAHYQRAAQLQPDYPETYNNLGNLLARERRFGEAIGEYERALRLRPGFAAARANLCKAHCDFGAALGNAGRMAEAGAEYRRALAVQPGDPEAESGLGLALAYGGAAEEALPHLRRAVDARPDSPELHTYLGFALEKAGRPGEAADEYRRAERLRPSDPEIHYHLGQALRAAGRYDEAERELDAAARLHSAR